MNIFRSKFGYLIESTLVSLVIAVVIPFIFLLRLLFTREHIEIENFVTGFIFSFTVSFCIYFFNIHVVKKMHQKEKFFRSQTIRIVVELLLTMSISGIVMTIIYTAFCYLYGIDPQKAHTKLFDNIIIAFIVNVVIVTLFEIIFFFRKWKNSLIESEQLRRQNVEIQFAALTNQINPHFLFNSLNALSTLIQEDQSKALIFTSEFSKIYRYVLDSKNKLIVSLQDELNFLNSYLYLQKIRFEKGLNHQTEIDMNCLDYFLPPLSLQLLVENAIKHNEISEDHPLYLSIRGRGTEVIVSNNFQPKEKNSTVNGIGLKNLTERYSHYTDRPPIFKVENGQYIAIIPLLRDE